MSNNKLIVSAAPHIFAKQSTRNIMLDVIIALVPAFIGSIIYFGIRSLLLTLLAIAAAVITEFIIVAFKTSKNDEQLMAGIEEDTSFIKKTILKSKNLIFSQKTGILDLSAVVTGMLLAFNLPPTSAWWIPVIGSFFAIAIAKHAFGGIGNNFMNPALAARAFLVASWGGRMTNWVDPVVDRVTSATPLAFVKGADLGANPYGLWDLFIGRIGGCLGETSALLLIIGGIYLVWRGVISWRIPATYIGTVFVLSFLFAPSAGLVGATYHVFSGGLMLGAIYMATDYSSSPVTPKGKIIFAVGCGVITTLIRFYGGYPEGVSYAILLMNVSSPLIEKFTRPRVYGEVR
jgi:Na+-translocating ferredoxin:NAD+ oxidoreductase subunit D